MDFEQLYRDELKAHRFTKIELHDLKYKQAHIKHLTEKETTKKFIKQLLTKITHFKLQIIALNKEIEELKRNQK